MAIDREALLASLPPEYLTPANLGYWSSLDDQSLQTSVSSIKRNLGKSFDDLMALGEKQTDWQKAAADYAKQNIYGNYAVDDPLAYYNAFGTIPINSLGKSYYGIDEKTWQTDTKEGAEGIKYLEPTAGATYKLYSPKYGTVYGTASTPAELANLAKIAQDQTLAQGRKADWELVQTTPGAEDQVVASNYWNSDVTPFGKIFGSLLPIATAFIPGLNLLGTIATQTASGAAGAAMAGRNPLTGALIGGATAGLMGAPILKGGQSISGSIGNALGAGTKTATQAATEAAGQAAGAAAGDIIVTAAPKIFQTAAERAVNAAAQGGVGALTGRLLDQSTQRAVDQYASKGALQTTQPTTSAFDQAFPVGTDFSNLPAITVTGQPIAQATSTAGSAATGALTGGLTAATNAAANQPSTSQTTQQTQEQPSGSTEDIVVKAYKEGLTIDQIAARVNISPAAVQSIISNAITSGTSPITAGAGRPEPTTTTTTGAVTGGLTAATNAATANTPRETPPKEDILVKGKPETKPTPTPVIPPTTTTTTTQPTETKADAKAEAETPKEKSTLDKIVDYLQIAGLGTGLIGDLLGGGGGSGALGTIPAGLFGTGTGTSVFNKPLPAPNLPGLGVGGTGIGARTAADLTATTGLPTPGSGASNIDWYRYGYGPEQSFFKQVPQGAKNASQAFTGYEVPFRGLQNMAEGGYAEADDDTNERIARKRIEEEQRASGGNYSVKRSPKFRHRHSFDDGLFSNYMLDVPVGEGSLLLNASGKGVLPEYYTVGAQYPLGDMGLRASHTLHGGSEYGVSGPLLGGDVDVSAYSGRGFVPEGVRLSYRRRFDDGGYAVGGPGDGRDDKIPAMLSDGEYVMDAETVAMLGNGSSKAGADALDRFRVNIRKHKGRSMARGNFSVKAKKPEKYLQKDRA